MPYTMMKDADGYWVMNEKTHKKMHKKAHKRRKEAIRHMMALKHATEQEKTK